ncbi:hypothetical protein [Zobellia russellii]|uniref:hypothetical protein n=1 Tax=Zobellia russellii TaxID=248907 RepID=UPI001BFF3294|nr:hypothetical protein [Zobellia russellii]MBT9190430.1 hypothetical protein [Zobellia russellii]
MSYFGLLKDLHLNSLTMDELTRLQVTRGILQEVTKVSLSLDGKPNAITSKNSETLYVPNVEMTKEFYDFILEVYEDVIENSLIGFFHAYEEDILGLDEIDKRKIALDYYKEVARLTIKDEFDILTIRKSATGHRLINRAKKLELFNMRQEVLQENLTVQNPMPLTHFLIGDAAYFDERLIAKLPVLNEVLKFEASLRILLTLNEQFNFEEDDSGSTSNSKNLDATQPIQKKKKAPLLSDVEATNFLIDTVFSKQLKKYGKL